MSKKNIGIILLVIGLIMIPITYFVQSEGNFFIDGNLNITGNIESMFIKYTETGDDKGVRIEGGQFSVGTPYDPREAVFGGGDSTTDSMVTFHYNGSVYTDVTDILKSDANSSIGIFGGNTSGNMIYLGSDFTYGGAKVKIVEMGDVEGGNVQGEYWNGTHWDPVNFMVADADFPYTQHANVLASHVGNQQWRFGQNRYPWVKSTINGVEKYWGRFRIVSNITKEPIIEQIKMHTNRFEINSNGFTEYYGNARYPGDLQMHWHLTESLQGFTPASDDIDFASGLTLDYSNNKFQNNRVDGRGGYIILPEGIDTSIPMTVELLWQGLASTTGNVDFEFLYTQKRVGELMTTTDIPISTNTITSVLSNETNVLKKSVFLIDINELLPGEIVAFGLKRDATVSNTNDTYTGDISIVNIRSIAYFWKP